MARRRRWWPVIVIGLTGACGGDPGERLPVPIEDGAGVEADRWMHAVAFERGVVLEGIGTPTSVEPGATMEVRFSVRGPAAGLTAVIGAQPPRAASRQVTVGGQGAPPVHVPVDPRVRTQTVELTEGEHRVELVVPTPWHPRQVLITAELLDGSTRVPAVRGPRREDGLAMLAAVDVPARPTPVTAVQAPEAVSIDGRLDEPVWEAAVAHPMVHSLDGEPYDDRPSTVRWAWDASALYVAVQIEDPDVWSEYTEQDDPLWKQEVFEVFIFGDRERRGYLELQVSPRGTTFDARFERYRKGDEDWDSRWQTAVDLQGTVGNRRDRDLGWSAEVAIPWDELCAHTEVTCPPAPGQRFAVNAFRFERPHKRPPVGLALSPPRVPDFHAPQNAAVLELGGP